MIVADLSKLPASLLLDREEILYKCGCVIELFAYLFYDIRTGPFLCLSRTQQPTLEQEVSELDIDLSGLPCTEFRAT